MQKTKSKSKDDGDEKKEGSPTHRLIALLGMIGSRNFILALRIHKAVTGKFPDLNTQKNPFSAPDILKRSLEIEEIFTRNKFAYPETVFAAALAYDWLYFIAARQANFKKLEPYFQDTWKRMLRYAFLGHCLASRAPNFGFHKFAAAGAMLTQVGKLHMALN